MVVKHLEETGLIKRCVRPQWEAVTDERLGRVHCLDYVKEVERFATSGGGRIEADTMVSAQSYEVARLAAGAACDATAQVLSGKATNALCLVRPPGHHALQGGAMGFCLFNQVAVAARVALAEFGLSRVLIVDWDVHHGNGTQDAFWTDGQVGFYSIHRFPFYPGSGAADETGAGKGLGMTRNVPITFGTSRADYLAKFTDSLTRFADQVKPELVLISAGFDAHAQDPIGSLGLEVEDFRQLSRVVQQVAATHARGRIVSLLEGGYNVDVLPKCVATHLEDLLGDGR
jgi:acetoin utilization deacetylase AcuC-like enzyme